MINKEFIRETNKLIKIFKSRGIAVENANMVVAKVKADEVTAGGLIIPKKMNEIKDYHNGLARIVALAPNCDKQYKVGDYVIHAHEARYKPFTDALREFLAYAVDEDFLFTISDNNVIMRLRKL